MVSEFVFRMCNVKFDKYVCAVQILQMVELGFYKKKSWDQVRAKARAVLLQMIVLQALTMAEVRGAKHMHTKSVKSRDGYLQVAKLLPATLSLGSLQAWAKTLGVG